MLDMDGTVLDLAYDNYVWKELVPERYAEAKGLSLDDARNRLFQKYESIQGDLEWYCLDDSDWTCSSCIAMSIIASSICRALRVSCKRCTTTTFASCW